RTLRARARAQVLARNRALREGRVAAHARGPWRAGGRAGETRRTPRRGPHGRPHRRTRLPPRARRAGVGAFARGDAREGEGRGLNEVQPPRSSAPSIRRSGTSHNSTTPTGRRAIVRMEALAREPLAADELESVR